MGTGIPKWARYDPSRILGSGCAVNMVTGARSLGKTYAFKKQFVKNYIKRGQTCCYLRYNQAMIDRVQKATTPFLADLSINNEFPDYLIRMEGNRMQIAERSDKPKWETFGFLASLTSFDSFKGSTTPNMSMLMLDEFIKEKRVPPYPPGCVDALMNIWETFDRRENRVRLFLVANAADIVNPFFRAWRISPIPKGTCRKFPVGNSYVFYENAYSAEFEKYSSDTNIGAFTAGSSYADYATSNSFNQVNGLFVRERPKTARCSAAIKFFGMTFGVWSDRLTGDVYIDRKPSKDAMILVLSKNDMEPDYMMLDRNAPYLKYPARAFRAGQLYFSDDGTRESFMEVLTLCGVR